MANHFFTKFVLICLAATTINSYVLHGQAALKNRRARQCPTCPADSPELLSSPWYGTPRPLYERNKRSPLRPHRDTEVHRDPKKSIGNDETSITTDNEKEAIAYSSQASIDLSRVTYANENDESGQSKASNGSSKQRRHTPEYHRAEVVAPNRIVLASPKEGPRNIEGRTFVLRRVEETTTSSPQEKGLTSYADSSSYLARFERLLSLYEEVQKFREEYSKKSIYQHLENALYHVFETIVLDHLPSLLMPREDVREINGKGRNGKRNCEDPEKTLYESDEDEEKDENIGKPPRSLLIPENDKTRSLDALEYTRTARRPANSDSFSYENSRDYERALPREKFETRGNRHADSGIRDKVRSYESRRVDDEQFDERDSRRTRFSREPTERLASDFPYRFFTDENREDKAVYRRMAPIDRAADKRGTKRETEEPALLFSTMSDDGNLKAAKLPKISEHEKSARIARSPVDESSSASNRNNDEETEASAVSKESAIVDDQNSKTIIDPKTSERIARSQMSAKFDGFNVPENVEKLRQFDVPENYARLEDVEKFIENSENLEKIIYEKLKKFEASDNLNVDEVEAISILLERLKNMERDAGIFMEVEPAYVTIIDDTSTSQAEKPTIEKSPVDTPPPSTTV